MLSSKSLTFFCEKEFFTFNNNKKVLFPIFLTAIFLVASIALFSAAMYYNNSALFTSASICALSSIFMLFIAAKLKSTAKHLSNSNKSLHSYISKEPFQTSIDLNVKYLAESNNVNIINQQHLPKTIRKKEKLEIDNKYPFYNVLLCNTQCKFNISKENAQKTFMRVFEYKDRSNYSNNSISNASNVLFPSLYSGFITGCTISDDDFNACISKKHDIQSVLKTHFKIFLSYYGMELVTDDSSSTIKIYKDFEDRIDAHFCSLACKVLMCLGSFKMEKELQVLKIALDLIYSESNNNNKIILKQTHIDKSFKENIAKSYKTATKLLQKKTYSTQL